MPSPTKIVVSIRSLSSQGFVAPSSLRRLPLEEAMRSGVISTLSHRDVGSSILLKHRSLGAFIEGVVVVEKVKTAVPFRDRLRRRDFRERFKL